MSRLTMKILQISNCGHIYEMYNMADTEKGKVCHRMAREVTIRWQHLIFYYIHYSAV